ncbi:MAG: hypothetical protein IPM91_06185 [Bacteroidetes bacterium]|nr:hypothetical protein [Bacteroidota bacterium]
MEVKSGGVGRFDRFKIFRLLNGIPAVGAVLLCSALFISASDFPMIFIKNIEMPGSILPRL